MKGCGGVLCCKKEACTYCKSPVVQLSPCVSRSLCVRVCVRVKVVILYSNCTENMFVLALSNFMYIFISHSTLCTL